MSRAILYIGILLMTLATFVYYPKWKMTRTEATISWDVSGYYIYLPAIFIYHDIKKLSWKPAIDEKYYPSSSPYQSFTHNTGNQVMKYTGGLAILYSPFFSIAHWLAQPLGFEADGYSKIYQFAISLGSLVFAFMGLWYVRKILLQYFNENTTAIAIGIIILATNYFDYASITGAMSHNYLFTLYAALIYYSDRFYKSNLSWYFYLCSAILGLMVLIRPTEIIASILVVFWNIHNISEIRARIKYLIHSGRTVPIGIVCFLFFPFLQSLYWKYATGEWIVYSYQDQGFSWLEGHHILQGLFSYKAGWLVYTPVMILVFTGMWLGVKNKYSNQILFTVFILSSLYLTFAWDEWTYGGSLSQRALVQHYPIMAFPLAVSIGTLLSNHILKFLSIPFIVLCIYYNLWLTHHAHKGGIYEAGMMNKSYFWYTLFKNENKPEYKKMLDLNEPLYTFDEKNATLIRDTSFLADSNCASATGYTLLYNDKVKPGKIKVNVFVQAALKEWDVWQMAQLVVKYKNKEQDVKTTILRLHRFLNDNEEKWIDLVTVNPNRIYDHLEITIWNPSTKQVCAKQLKLYVEK